MSQFFNSEEALKEVDWTTVKRTYWFDTEEDPDRKRRKQAEFLVYKELSLSVLLAVGVYNEKAKEEVLSKFANCNATRLVVVVKPKWYY